MTAIGKINPHARIVAAAMLLSSCTELSATLGSDCSKDYVALKAREIATIDQGSAIEDGFKSEADLAKLPAEQRKLVEDAEALLQSRTRVADEKDLEIVDRARAMLRNESVWDRADDRKCQEGDTKFSLYCALYFASKQAVGTYEHRRTALQEVRFALEDATRGRTYEHRLRDFNNDPQTKLTDIYGVLAVARRRLAQRLADQLMCRL